MNHLYLTRRYSLLSLFLVSITIVSANTYTVTNTNDAGAGSLRQAILDANTNPGPDIINFNIAGVGPFVIAPVSGLPVITDAVTIDGYSQPGSAQGTISGRTIMIVIDGTGAGASIDGLVLNASNITVDGLAIRSFSRDGIDILNLAASTLFIWGNYIGTDDAGLAAFGNGRHGINMGDPAGPGGNTAITIGTDGNGTNDANEGNLIVGNTTDGIAAWSLTNLVIAGNIIGLDKNGANSLGNKRNGILFTVSSNNNRIGTNGDGVSDALEGNTISGNGTAATDRGIFITANSNNNVIAGNVIGLNASNAAAANTGNGIEILNSSTNRIGLNAADANPTAERNTISSNAANGILINTANFFGFNFNSNGNIVAGNYIGTTSGALVRGNAANGIQLTVSLATFTVSNNIIGSDGDDVGDDLEANVIANNVNGIVTNNSTDIASDRFSRNSIYNNTQLGIDLSGDGVTPNDDGDVDTGPNGLYNFPVITDIHTTVENNLILAGFARPGAVIEFYIADAGPHPNPLPGTFTKDFGEGQTYLFRAQEGGTLNGITDLDATVGTYTGTEEGTGTGGTRTENKFLFSVPLSTLPAAVNGGTRITSLNYDAVSGAANTSEFSGVFVTTVNPVTYISLQARYDNGNVYVNWKTGFETNNYRFDVERSADGITFTKIGQVSGRGGSNQSYSFIDPQPLKNVNYYRLKQIDLDGKFNYSRVLVVRTDLGKLNVRITPNPVVNNANLTFSLNKPEMIQVLIYDQMGRLSKRFSLQGNKGINTFNLPGLETLPAGNYIVEVAGETVSAKQQIFKK